MKQRLRRLATGIGWDAHPLRRSVDRAEALATIILIASFLVAWPVAAFVAGGSPITPRRRSSGPSRAGIRSRRPCCRVRPSRPPLAGDWDVAWVPAKWTLRDGQVRHGRVGVELDAKAGQQVRIRSTHAGQQTPQRLSAADVEDEVTFAVLTVTMGLGVLYLTFLGILENRLWPPAAGMLAARLGCRRAATGPAAALAGPCVGGAPGAVLRAGRPGHVGPEGAHAGMGGRGVRAGRRGAAARGWSGRSRSQALARSASGSAAAGSAGPTCTWPRVTCRRGDRSVTPGHEIVGRVDALGAGRAPGSRSATASACRGWAAPTGPAASAAAARRTSASTPVHRLGHRRRLRRRLRGRRGVTPTGCPTGSTTSTLRRCCARASSATGRCAAPAVPPGGQLGIYGFGGSAHITAQVALRQGLRVHVLTRGEGNQRARG